MTKFNLTEDEFEASYRAMLAEGTIPAQDAANTGSNGSDLGPWLSAASQVMRAMLEPRDQDPYPDALHTARARYRKT